MPSEPLTPDERRQLLLSVSTHRGKRPLSPVEVSALFAKVIDSGGSLADCARAASLEGTTMVGRFLRLRKLSPSIVHLVDWGSGSGIVGFSSAAEIARLDTAQEQDEVVQAVLAHRLSGSEVRQIVQLRKRSSRPLSECITEVVGMRPTIEKRFVYVGVVTDDMAKQRLASMTQQQRDQILASALRTALPGVKPAVSRLGADRFTLVGRDDLGNAIASKGDRLEAEVNGGLLRELR